MNSVPTVFLLSSRHEDVTAFNQALQRYGCAWPVHPIADVAQLEAIQPPPLAATVVIFGESLPLTTDQVIQTANRLLQQGYVVLLIAEHLAPTDVMQALAWGCLDCVRPDELFKVIALLQRQANPAAHALQGVGRENLELQHQKYLAQYFLDVANVMIVAVDQNLNITLINRKGCEILGYDAADLLNRNWVTSCVPQAEQTSARQFFSSYFNQESFRLDYTETTVRMHSGQERLIGWHNTLLDTEDFEHKVIISSGQDITDEHLMWQRKDTFVATLTHDLKTPIRAEYQALELVLNENFGPLTPDLREVLAEMLRSNRFMQRLVDNLLAIYKYEDRQIKLDKQPTDLHTLIQTSVVPEIAAMASDKHQQLDLRLNADITTTTLDATEIRQVLSAILHNAVLFSPEGARIRLSTRSQEAEILVIIEDFGQGIAPDVLKNLFTRYSSITKKFRQVGTGLSLYLARQIIEAHGGHISVESHVGQGSRFTFSLPLQREAASVSG